MNNTNQTPLEDLRNQNLKHYDEASSKVNHWSSAIPSAINFFYDYKKMSLWQKIRLAFKQ